MEKWKDSMDNSQIKTEVIVKKIKPKYVGQKCPVCNGFGTLKFGSKLCQGCDGKGFIWVPTEEVKNG